MRTQVTHPHHHHATRAAQALTVARRHLDDAVARETADRRDEARIVAAASSLQAWRPIPGPTGRGGHGDPAGRTVVDFLEPEVRDGQLGRLAGRTTATLTWLAGALALPTAGDPLPALAAAVPTLRPSTARHLARWLDEADQQIRDRLALDDDGTPIPGLRCPRCARRQLTAHTTGPRPTWTVTCTPTCLCVGPDCPCTMPTRVVDVAHIWGPDHPLTARSVSAA
ncbi:hypothetical protein [Micromonospora carbonacea]|uniref:Uncharacterized protein n=1 Tax=Micromonospora carbonacea TaxID=47853 RepID=A0A1C4WY96_9ACTN|nr:hypothetical protein [Micromonospora carbonacea]SCF01195.1 hypothetical protein GA0070563_104110 [Micromonospora carbonacea]